MKRVILVVLFVVSLASMLCIGFVMGAVFTPLMARTFNLAERVFNRDRIEFNTEPRIFINPPQERQFNFQQQNGALIVEVIPDSPADQAGLKVGDLIVSLDGQAVKSGEELARLLGRYEPGDTVEIAVLRSVQEERSITVKLGENPDRVDRPWLGIRYGADIQMPFEGDLPQLPESEQPALPALPSDEIPLPPMMEHPGALIREVLPGSPAEEAGLEAGQLIQAVDGKPISASNSLSDVIATYHPGDTISLTVYDGMKSGKPREVKVELGENPDREGAAWLGIRFVVIDLNDQGEDAPGG